MLPVRTMGHFCHARFTINKCISYMYSTKNTRPIIYDVAIELHWGGNIGVEIEGGRVYGSYE